MSQNKLSQGSAANRQGKVLENTIIPAFIARGFELVSFSQWEKQSHKYGKNLLLKHVPYTTIYGQKGYTEFLVQSESYNLNVRIECKWQQSSGSVDEKFPYLYLNCVEAMPEQDIIVIYGGGGMKLGAIPWLKAAVENSLYQSNASGIKNIQILSVDEFLQWANKVLR